MSAHLKDRVEKIQQLVLKLAEESQKGKPTVVEGKKDAQALRTLGIMGTIVTLKTGGKSFLDASTEIAAFGAAEVILLLDFDRRGKEGTSRMQQDLERQKVKVNVKFWKELHGLVGREVQCIESLPAYLETIQEKAA